MHLANYRSPSGQRVLFYNQADLSGVSEQEGVAVNDDYGITADGVQNVVEPTESYSVWYCSTITNPLTPLQGVQFMYKKFGKFNYFEEFNQLRYQEVRTSVFNNSTNTDYSAYTDIFLEKVYSYVMDSPVDIIELDYKTLHSLVDNNMLLDFRMTDVERKDSLYSYKTIENWDGTSGNTFGNWKRYKHMSEVAGAPDAIHPTNPYLNVQNQPSYQYSRETFSGTGEMPFDHGFLESDRQFNNQPVYPGDIYEIRTKVTRLSSTDLDNGNGTLDIAIRTGTNGNSASDESNLYNPTSATNETQAEHDLYKGIEIFSTFGSPVKWQMGHQQNVLNTSNFFVMPNIPSTYHGFNIQIGPGNSDIDFGSRSDVNTILLNNYVPNVLNAYPYAQNVGRKIKSTQQIPHNFGTGHPWSMMIPVYNMMALSGSTSGNGSPASPEELYETWWATANDIHTNIPTKFDENVKLAEVELIRYSKNPYMLQGVRVYKMNGDYAGIESENTTGKQLVAQKKLEYSYDDQAMLRNYKYSTGQPLILENHLRRIILLKSVREIPLDVADLYDSNYGGVDTNTILTTFLGYRKFLDAQEDILYGATYDANKPYTGLTKYLLYSYVDHLGGINKVDYYPLAMNSASRWRNNYTFTSCSNYMINNPSIPDVFHVDPFGRDQSYTAHAAVQYMGKNDENDVLLTSNYLGGTGVKVWEYVYDLQSQISNPKQLELNQSHFRKHHIIREETAFGKVRVYTPELATGEKNYTDYEYYGNTDATLSIDEYLYYGKLKSVKNYSDAGVLHDEKFINYGHTLAFTNAYTRPNLMREQLGYDDLLVRAYEYKDIYLNDILSMDVPDPAFGGTMTVTGENAYPYLDVTYLQGTFTDREQPKLLEFNFYNDLIASNPEFMLQSYFVKKTDEINRVYENSMSKSTTTTTGPPIPLVNKSSNPHGAGIINSKSNDPETDGDQITEINEQGSDAVGSLLAQSPLSDSVLIYLMAASNVSSTEKATLLAYQQGLSNEVIEKIFFKLNNYSAQDLKTIIAMQPYFSDTSQLYLLEKVKPTSDPEVFKAVMTKNLYLTDAVVTEMTRSGHSYPAESFADILENESQFTETILTSIISSSYLTSINLTRVLQNQYMSDARFTQIINNSAFEEDHITDLFELTVSFPTDNVLLDVLNHVPLFSVDNAERVMDAAERDLSEAVLNLIDSKYSTRQAARIKPDLTQFNLLSPYCNNPVIFGRNYIETKNEYEYYEADYTGQVVGAAYEVLMGHRESHDDPSPFPISLVDLGYDALNQNFVANALRLKHEPSWQVYAVKTSSPEHPDAYNRQEYYYLYDLQNRYDRYWYNYDLANPSGQFAVDIPIVGNLTDTLVANDSWPLYYSGTTGNGYPTLPQFDGMERTRMYGNRTLAFQKSEISKNSRDVHPIMRSEYYHYDARWIFDDLSGERETVNFSGDPCPPPPPPGGCETVEECTDCYPFFYKPFIVLEEVVPMYSCAWYIPGYGAFICPIGSNTAALYPNAIEMYCNDGFIDSENKALPIGEFLSKTLQLRDVTVQLDTLDHSLNQEFSGMRIDRKNAYVVEFYMEKPSVEDANGFPAPLKMVFPFDHLTVRTIKERNRYLQPELEENQVGLQTKYYYDKATAYWNVNTNCAATSYTSVTNTNIGLPNRICIGYNKTDSLSTSYTYTPVGLVSKVTEPSGKFMEYTFDLSYHRLKSIRENGNRLLSDFEYSNWEHDGSLSFDNRTDENYVKTYLYNVDPLINPQAQDFEIRKAFLDPLARNQSVVSAYYGVAADPVQIHSGSVAYDNWGRVIRSYKNYTETLPDIKATTNLNMPYAGSVYENDPKQRAIRTSNYDVDVLTNPVVKSNFVIANNIFTSCELGLSIGELPLIMGTGSTSDYRFYRSEILDQDDKRSISYTNAIGQQVATLKYNDQNQKIVTLFVYDSYGNLSKVINPEKQQNTFEYNILGQLVMETSVDAGTKRYMYNKQGLVSVEQDQNARTNTVNNEPAPYYRVYQYDDYGRLLKVGRKETPFDYTHSDEYDPLYYETIFIGDAPGDPLNGVYGATGYYFDYTYSNISSQDWLTFFDAWAYTTPPSDYIAVEINGLHTQFNATSLEKEFFYGTTAQSADVGRLLQTNSYDNANVKIQSEVYTYNTNDNIATQLITFDADGIDVATGNLESFIEYPAYNFRNSLLEQKVDVDNDQTVDLHCFIEYDKLNRLSSISAAAGQVNNASEATLLVSYEYDDANGLITKKKHFIDETQMGVGIVNHLVNEIEYQFDTRDRLTQIKAGQLTAGLSPLMQYNLSYDGQSLFYMDGNTLETVTASMNHNGNINGTLMSHYFDGNDVVNNVSNFDKPTLYGYTYDRLNRMTNADATVGDLTLASGHPDYTDSYRIGDVDILYDRIGNIQSLSRVSKTGQGSSDYAEFTLFNYGYQAGNNRLLAANGLSGTVTRNYTYDANGNLLSDDFRTIDATEYGRASYPYHIDKESDDIDYLYSIGDQRIFKSVTEPSGTVESYYLMDGMGKTIAIRTYDGSTENWEYYLSGSERECNLVPLTNQAPGANVGNTDVEDMTFEKGQVRFYAYDHLGNTRLVYSPDGYTTNYTVSNIAFVASYFPYGKVLREFVDGDEERYLTTQHERDRSTGLDYRGARYYDSDVARFLSLDPLSSDYPNLSSYAYVAGNPVFFFDPDGLYPRPVTSLSFRAMAKIIGFTSNYDVGRLFENLVIDMVQQTRLVTAYSPNYFSKARNKLNAGMPSSVRPDGIQLDPGVEVAEGNGGRVQIRTALTQHWYEAKATKSTLTKRYRKGQILGMIDALSSLKNTKMEMPALTLLTTSDTKISQELVKYADTKGVRFYHSKLYFDSDTGEFSLSDPIHLTLAYGADDWANWFFDSDNFDTFGKGQLNTLMYYFKSKTNVPGDPDPAKAD